MILFNNKIKIKWEWDNFRERKTIESQLLTNQILKDKIEKNNN
jgi:hypothetical protein